MNTLIKILFAGFGGFIFLLPLYYSFETQQIFEVNKFALLCIFTGIISALTGFLFLTQKRKKSKFLPELLYSRNFWIFSGIFFLSIFCSSFLSQTPIIAFLGGTSRHQGMIFLGMIFFIVLATLCFFSPEKTGNKNQIQKIQKFLVFPLLASAFISSLLAISQYYGNFSGYPISETFSLFDFHILEIKDVSMRSLGAMGQPNFLAQFLLIPLFLTLTLFIISLIKILQKKNISQIFIFFSIVLYSFVAGIIIFGIHTTGSRAGEYIGIGTGIILLCTFLGLHFLDISAQKKQKIFWGILSGFSLLALFLVIYIFSHPEVLSFLGERTRSILARMQFWKESLPLLTQNFSSFFFGIGGDNLASAFQPIASVRLNELEGFSYSPDRSHTIFLDFLIHYGVIASVIFWGFLLRIFWNSTQIFFHPETSLEKKIWIAGIFSGLAATIGSWSVGFYVTTDATIFMIFLGILSILSYRDDTNIQKKIQKKTQKNNQNIFQNKIFQYFISGVLFFSALLFFWAGHITKNSDIAKYQSTLPYNNPEKTLSQDEIQKYLFRAPHLEGNFLSQFSGLQKDRKHDEEILKIAEEKGFHSFTFYFQKFIFSQNKASFMQAKKSAGNNIDSHVALFNLAKAMGVLSEKELVAYAKEVFVMVPDKYYEPVNWMNPEIQKFWKHHGNFVIILEYADK